MKVVCISEFLNDLTFGEVYEVQNLPGEVYYNLARADGHLDLYNKQWFKPLEEYRRNKIDSILNGTQSTNL